MGFRTRARRVVVWGTALLLLLVVTRYAYAHFGKFGFSSPLAWNRHVAGYAIAASGSADWRNLQKMLSGVTRKGSPAEMQNENFGEMRVPISREALRMVPEVPPATVVEEFKVEKGLLTLAREAAAASGAATASAAVTTPAPPTPSASGRNDWIAASGNDEAQRHSPLTQINAGNVANLKLLYSVDAAALFRGAWDASVQASPMAWDKYLYWLSADQRLVAVEAATGKVVWSVLVPRFGYSRRGFLIQPREDGKEATVYVPFGTFIGAFDARTGSLDTSHLGGGVCKLDGWTVISPLIAGDTMLVALYHKRSIVALDLRTGQERWSLALHDPNANFEGATQWGGMTIDRATQTLFVTTGNPRPALIGITRPGANKNSDSVIAIDLATHKIKWTFQEVAHDLWDLDIPGTPMLTTLAIEGRRYDVVTTVTKMGNTLLLDRATGKPIHDFRWRRAPKSRMANEQTADYQPDVEVPEPLMSMAWDPSRVTQVSAERRASVERQISAPGTIYGRFRAPELNKDLITFGVHGGAEWHGATVDPDGTVYVPINDTPWLLRVFLLGDAAQTGSAPVYQARCASCHLPSRNGQFESVGEAARKYVPSLHGYTLLDENRRHFSVAEFQQRPGHAKVTTTQADLDAIWTEFGALDDALFKSGKASLLYAWRQLLDNESMPGSAPPWGKVAAVNLASGRKLWEAPLGSKTISGAERDTGSPSFGGLVGTAGGLLFVAGTDDQQVRAIDKKTGATLWKYRMDATGSAPPISFEVDGKQYIAVVASGGRFHNFVKRANKLYVFGL